MHICKPRAVVQSQVYGSMGKTKNAKILKKKIIQIFFSPKVFKFTWYMRNVLKRMKNEFSDLYFSSYGYFCTQNDPNFDEFSPITQKIKIVDFFSYFSITLPNINKNRINKPDKNWGGGGLHIHNWDIVEIYLHVHHAWFLTIFICCYH